MTKVRKLFVVVMVEQIGNMVKIGLEALAEKRVEEQKTEPIIMTETIKSDEQFNAEEIAKQIAKTIRTVNQELRKKEEISFAILMLTEKEYQKLRWCPGDIIEGSFKNIGEK